jgi:cleavage and polyadenylation specificity factor subunit 1
VAGKIDTEDSDFFAIQERIIKMRYFNNIAGYNGVFVCGSNPHWIFMTARGELRTHPMTIDGEVLNFAPFNNINCPQGFLYFNKKSELRIGVLPTHLSYDAPWPVRKVPLRCTPHFVTYHLESKTYCLVTSIAEPSNKYYKFNGEDKELSIEDKGDRFPYPLQEKFSLMLFSPVSWDVIPNTKIDLDEWEHVNCLKNVALAYEGTRSGLKGYIAVGTNYNYGEDVTSRGRILIYDIIEVVPEPGQPLTKNRFKEIYAKDQKGPVTALSQVKGFLVSAVGQKVQNILFCVC